MPPVQEVGPCGGCEGRAVEGTRDFLVRLYLSAIGFLEMEADREAAEIGGSMRLRATKDRESLGKATCLWKMKFMPLFAQLAGRRGRVPR